MNSLVLISLAAGVTTRPAIRPANLVVIGGGAAGFFGAIRAASLAPSLRVLLLEASPRCLTKVSISGGGRCNVCHDETKEVRQLASGYPRGERAMLGTFTKRFGAKDAAAWFRARGVELKTEADGRMFPTTDDSATIVNALSDAARKAGVEVLTRCKVTKATGPVLITHKGLSGPACLRLSAFAARELAEHQYRAEVSVSWAPHLNEEQAVEELRGFGARAPNKALGSYCPVGLPKRLWANLVTSAGVDPAKTWAQLPKVELRRVAQAIVASKLRGVGKSTNKDEFVTAGGADLSQLHAHSFECKEPPGLFLAGEVLDVDGITGGYNFLNAWATSWCAGTEIARDVGAVVEQ
ncbi:hi0933 family protein [Chrysochromulina tobinii]|uniref:Hi0933 family protein n=1 Tax=Chrysochromulina tobinii TaxID=1460289 RepID=A0A0M0K665_9EUKA|nr:hi0933 family protein [Chrysochromulina tobinii]|eukprot:KOO34082.1 hi0933 family protein [Chrysochromulina sp. CCMP291]